MYKKLKNPSKKYPWLTRLESRRLTSGAYFDNEGSMHNIDDCVRCTAVVKSVGNRCKNFAIPGELFCRIHGGISGRTKANTLRVYSAFIQDPTLKNVYENALDNEEVAGTKEELSLLRVLLANLIQKADMDNIKSVKEISSVIAEIRALVKDCTTAEIRLGQLIDVGKVTIIVGALAKIISKYIKDEKTLEKISTEFDNVIWPAPLASTPQPVRKTPSREVSRLPGKIC